ncbi:MAG TPA: hypothetical protein VNC78_10260 [Actinomycetota bacterium]|nr:hypothetical protein [Actinomycetota bacterium]
MRGTIVRRIGVALMSAVALAALAGTAPAETVRIRAFGEPGTFHWHPTQKVAVRGDKVVWKNTTEAAHTVTSYGRGWSKDTRVAAAAATSFVFNKTGTFRFRCKIHSTLEGSVCDGMCGSVKVNAP